MKSHTVTVETLGIIIVVFASACNPTQSPSTPDQSVIETSVAETLVALEAVEANEVQTPTEEPVAPTSSPTGTVAPETEIPTRCEVVTNALNVRYGPGTIYAPPRGFVNSGEELEPTARNQDGTWVEVRAVVSGLVGWVSSAEQFIRCDADLLSLPVGEIPPTPTPSPTPPLLVVGAIEGTVDETVSDEVRLEVAANDPGIGTDNGAGIDFVRFQILFGGSVVYENDDNAPPYCATPGDPNCFYIFPDPAKWPNGTDIQEGAYIVRAMVHAHNGRVETVEAGFEVDLP